MTGRLVFRGSRLIGAGCFVLITGAVGALATKRFTSGDESSDAFRLAVIVGGKGFTSHATALRSASVLAVIGGLQLDLRDAALDPGGASLDITTFMGGVELMLPPGWSVTLETHGILGGVDTRLTEPADIPEGAPVLRVTTHTWLGGVEIRESEAASRRQDAPIAVAPS